VGSTQLRRPQAPTTAERARGIVSRGGQAALVGLGEAQRVRPLFHHMHPDGAAMLLLPSDHVLVEAVRRGPRTGLPAMLELTDTAPVALREPVRGLLWISGWLVAPSPTYSHRLALDAARERPHPRLPDLGHGATMLRLRPGCAVLADAEGTGPLTPAELEAAAPDPFCQLEHGWLPHLDEAHADVFESLRRHLPEPPRGKLGGRIRPLGVDRLGIRLRIEAPDGDHDVRLAFQTPADTAEQLGVQIRLLAGGPLRAAE
jgi:hypothetical protein